MILIAVLTLIQTIGIDLPAWLPITAMVVAVIMHEGGVSLLPNIMITKILIFQVNQVFY